MSELLRHCEQAGDDPRCVAKRWAPAPRRGQSHRHRTTTGKLPTAARSAARGCDDVVRSACRTRAAGVGTIVRISTPRQLQSLRRALCRHASPAPERRQKAGRLDRNARSAPDEAATAISTHSAVIDRRVGTARRAVYRGLTPVPRMDALSDRLGIGSPAAKVRAWLCSNRASAPTMHWGLAWCRRSVSCVLDSGVVRSLTSFRAWT